MRVRLKGDALCVGRHVRVSFQRTLRIPDDGGTYPLPPGLGCFPIKRVRDYARRVPARWREQGGYFIPMYQREALWIAFGGAWWRPNALQVRVGGVNAISGTPSIEALGAAPQNYLVVPEQPWLDGINAGDGFIRQFVAMPLGQGYTIEAQLTGREEEGGLQLVVYDPKPGRFPDRSPRPHRAYGLSGMMAACGAPMMVAETCMGLGAGGRMVQKVYPDEHGLETWDAATRTTVTVHIVNSIMYRAITGETPPPSPISARTYTECGYPWFALYDEHKGDIAAPGALQSVRSVGELEADKGIPDPGAAAPIAVPPGQVKGIDWHTHFGAHE